MTSQQHAASSLANLRKDYTLRGLSEADIDPDPFVQFRTWFGQALAAKLPEPNAMTLATVGADGRPSARIVLLKDVDERGFTFYTNYESRKARDLAAQPYAALIFYWADLERQVRIEGDVAQVSAAESDAYFQSRPRGSRLGAWTSPQSQVIADREVLDQRLAEFEARFATGDVSRPPHWGGYRVIPYMIEFWQGRPSRLHDRIRYRWVDKRWQIERLAP